MLYLLHIIWSSNKGNQEKGRFVTGILIFNWNTLLLLRRRCGLGLRDEMIFWSLFFRFREQQEYFFLNASSFVTSRCCVHIQNCYVICCDFLHFQWNSTHARCNASVVVVFFVEIINNFWYWPNDVYQKSKSETEFFILILS